MKKGNGILYILRLVPKYKWHTIGYEHIRKIHKIPNTDSGINFDGMEVKNISNKVTGSVRIVSLNVHEFFDKNPKLIKMEIRGIQKFMFLRHADHESNIISRTRNTDIVAPKSTTLLIYPGECLNVELLHDKVFLREGTSYTLVRMDKSLKKHGKDAHKEYAKHHKILTGFLDQPIAMPPSPWKC